jgi:chemosensory pili system protein ChpA (sensor histidine kinase/response regulator)
MGAFVAEAEEFLQSLEANLLQLETIHTASEATAVIKSLFRAAHSLKGSALMFGFDALAQASHCLEDSFGILRDRLQTHQSPEFQLAPAIFTELLRGVDLLKLLVNSELDQDVPTSQAQAGIAALEALHRQLEAEHLGMTQLSESASGQTVGFPHELATAEGDRPSDSLMDRTLIAAVLEQEFPLLHQRMETALAAAAADTLTDAYVALASLNQQLVSTAELFQLESLYQRAIAWGEVLAAGVLEPDALQMAGIVFLSDVEAFRMAWLAGDPNPVLSTDVAHPMPAQGESNPVTAISDVPDLLDFDALLDAALSDQPSPFAQAIPVEQAIPIEQPTVVVAPSMGSDILPEQLPVESALDPMDALLMSAIAANPAPEFSDQIPDGPESAKSDALAAALMADWAMLDPQPGVAIASEIIAPQPLKRETPETTAIIPPAIPADHPPAETLMPLTAVLSTGEPSRAPDPPVQTVERGEQKRSRRTVRVELSDLNTLINLVGELVINRTQLELQADQLKGETTRMGHKVRHLRQSGGTLRHEYDRLSLPQHYTGQGGFDALEMDQYTGFHTTAQAMIETGLGLHESAEQVEAVAMALENGLGHLQRITQQLRNQVMQLRVVPFSRVVDHLPRALRDLSHRYQKPVELHLFGRDTKIDESLLEALRDPIMHLVRNAFDHGIESEAERIAQGKPATGQIEIEAYHQGGQTLIIIRDNGRGIQPDMIRNRLVAKGLLTAAQAQTLSVMELYDWLFAPGFSTAEVVSDLSGRGVGLDVVRDNLQQVRGSIKIESMPGVGTSFILKLPLMLSIISALLVDVAGETLAIPLDAVEEILQVEQSTIQSVGKQQILAWRNLFLPVLSLSDLLHYQRTNFTPVASERVPILILENNETTIAIQVDALGGQQEIVVKPFPAPLAKPLGISGSTLLGAGDVVHIVDVDDVFSALVVTPSHSGVSAGSGFGQRVVPAERKDGGPASASSTAIAPTNNLAVTPLILVVDDAYTVRQLLSRTLTRAQYRVVEAIDGQDALEQLQRGLQARLIITDLEMPRLDGFGLLRSLKSDPHCCTIPTAVLTSRSGEKHRSLAGELGADAYLTKPYREAELLSLVSQLLTTTALETVKK